MRLRLPFVLVALLFGAPLMAQTVTGTMRGTVTDRSGGALPGVTITIRNVETGLERIVTTDSAGSWNAPYLQLGRYNVAAALSGFGTMRHQNVPVGLNQTTGQEVGLDSGMHATGDVTADP